jgi:hypothetical protein
MRKAFYCPPLKHPYHARTAQRVLARVQPFLQGDIAALALPARLSWQSICSGSGQADDWHNLACCANICLIQGEGIHSACVDLSNAAIDALETVRDRHQRTQKWGACHASLQAIPALLDFYEQLLSLCTPLQMQQAMTTVLQRMEKQRNELLAQQNIAREAPN